jgi:hypothetical protein
LGALQASLARLIAAELDDSLSSIRASAAQ